MSWIHREALPGGHRLRLGIGGPSRSGKTYSALRVAAGMVKILGGTIFLIDTDNEFSLDYADAFKFQIVDFQAPYSPDRYLQAIEYCVSQNPGVIIVDQMSHEQTGSGGVLERQQEIEKELSEKWKTSREKTSQAAWNQSKTVPHGKLVSYVTRVKQPIIFNFRAKDKIKVIKNPETGKQEWVHSGYTPICTEQFDYEMSAMLILPPNSDGTPDKDLSEIRQPLRGIVKPGEQITEKLGERLAMWVQGGQKKKEGIDTSTGEIVDPTPPESVQEGAGEELSPFSSFVAELDEKGKHLVLNYIATFKTDPAKIIEKANKNIEGFKDKYQEWLNA